MHGFCRPQPAAAGVPAGCRVVPLGVVTSTAVALLLPGHHAAKHPFQMLAVTRDPSLSSSVVPVTL